MRAKCLVRIGWIAFLLLPQEVRGDVEGLIKSLGSLAAAQYQQRLIEGAKKEGEVMLYSSSGQNEIDALTALFAKSYPFVKIRYLKKGGQQLFQVAQMEFKGGQNLADVYWAGTSTVGPLTREKGILARYFSPERKAIPEEFQDKNGLWTGTRNSIVAFAYHAKKVPAAKVPKSYQDLLDPFWKDNLAVDTNPGRFTRVLVERLGMEKAEQFHRRLAAQGLKLHRGRTARLQIMLAGEILGTPDINADNVITAQNEGAPLEYALIEPTILSLTAVALPNKAPHPHAALLLYDFILSDKGQRELAVEDNAPVREGVGIRNKELERRYRKMIAEKKFAVQSADNHEPELEEKYDQLYVRTLVRRGR
jgi:iron(III) transport system substrate-binding protein